MTAVCRNAAFVSLTELALVNSLNSVVFQVIRCANMLLITLTNVPITVLLSIVVRF